MSLDPKRRYLGKPMQGHWDWARDNVPLLTFRTSDEIARVVRVARDDVKGLTYIIEFFAPLASMLVAWRVTIELFPDLKALGHAILVTLAGLACSIVAQHIGLAIFRRKIASVAHYTYSPVSYG